MSNDLLCAESLDELSASPASLRIEVPSRVPAISTDPTMSRMRILTNLLDVEKDFLPRSEDFLREIQGGRVSGEHRRILGEWMRDVVCEMGSGPDTFCLSLNLLDRFLDTLPLGSPSQLQLLGSVCLLLASKLRDSESIPGRSLISYTDHSITSKELKDWELLVLHKLGWELNAITPIDYLDHLLPRLSFPGVHSEELRKYTETIIVLSSTEYSFSSLPQSLIAASSIIIAYGCLSSEPSQSLRRSLKSLLLLSDLSNLDSCVREISSILPSYLFTKSSPEPPAELSSKNAEESVVSDWEESSSLLADSPVPDLLCSEYFEEELQRESSKCLSSSSDDSSEFYRSDSPLSAVDIFTDFDSGVLHAVIETSEKSSTPKKPAGNTDSPLSILVS